MYLDVISAASRGGVQLENLSLTDGFYSNGWISIMGWWLGAASVANFVASMILEIVTVWYTDFTPQHWQQYLIYVGLTWLVSSLQNNCRVDWCSLLPLLCRRMSQRLTTE